MLEVSSTKKYLNLPCAHAQYFDMEGDGSPGECASIHGYDRSVEFTFSGSVDEHGWLVPFGELGQLKIWLEYYFDHVTVLPADDPRLDLVEAAGSLLNKVRILPYGVSMEMSSLFIWYHVNPWIFNKTFGRVYISKVICEEHERNSAFVTVNREIAANHAENYHSKNYRFLPHQEKWDFIEPRKAIALINSYVGVHSNNGEIAKQA